VEEQPLPTPETFPFPFTPYSIQVDFMRNLYTAIEQRKVGIFESPTGTVRPSILEALPRRFAHKARRDHGRGAWVGQGKSLSLACGALQWLEDHQRRGAAPAPSVAAGMGMTVLARTNGRGTNRTPSFIAGYPCR